MDKLIELFASSAIMQATVTTILVVTCCAMWMQGKPLPTELLGFTGATLGFWFGTKAQLNAIKSVALRTPQS